MAKATGKKQQEVQAGLTGHPMTQIELSQGKVSAASPAPATPGQGNSIEYFFIFLLEIQATLRTTVTA